MTLDSFAGMLTHAAISPYLVVVVVMMKYMSIP